MTGQGWSLVPDREKATRGRRREDETGTAVLSMKGFGGAEYNRRGRVSGSKQRVRRLKRSPTAWFQACIWTFQRRVLSDLKQLNDVPQPILERACTILILANVRSETAIERV